ncbi:hypothetical protein J6590_020292 [Homalodisca vitripennis]|nr:hypothetical protein J6590_020292 [Homalodisca vitripennis]
MNVTSRCRYLSRQSTKRMSKCYRGADASATACAARRLSDKFCRTGSTGGVQDNVIRVATNYSGSGPSISPNNRALAAVSSTGTSTGNGFIGNSTLWPLPEFITPISPTPPVTGYRVIILGFLSEVGTMRAARIASSSHSFRMLIASQDAANNNYLTVFRKSPSSLLVDDASIGKVSVVQLSTCPAPDKTATLAEEDVPALSVADLGGSGSGSGCTPLKQISGRITVVLQTTRPSIHRVTGSADFHIQGSFSGTVVTCAPANLLIFNLNRARRPGGTIPHTHTPGRDPPPPPTSLHLIKVTSMCGPRHN